MVPATAWISAARASGAEVHDAAVMFAVDTNFCFTETKVFVSRVESSWRRWWWWWKVRKRSGG